MAHTGGVGHFLLEKVSVSQAASSEARNTTASAISSGWPNPAPGGVAAIIASAAALPTKPIRWLPSVSVWPDATAFTPRWR